MKTAKKILAVCFIITLLLLTVNNAEIAAKATYKWIQRGEGLGELRLSLQEAYLSDDLWHKNDFVNLSGLYARLCGRRMHNDTLRLNNGMLTLKPEPLLNVEESSESIAAFSEWLSQENIPFLYVQIPYKVDTQNTLLPTGIEHPYNAYADKLLQLLQESDVSTLDLRSSITNSVAGVEKYFYNTDHHWTALGAFKGFQMTAESLQKVFPNEPICSQSLLNLDEWEICKKENQFLGWHGKRVGRYFGGVDDLIWIVPKFETSMSCAIPKRKEFYSGTFADSVIRSSFIEDDASYFDMSHYCVYIGGNYPLVIHRNEQAPIKKKILIVNDSFAYPYQSFMSTLFESVDVFDPRYHKTKTFFEYAAETQPDAVVMAISPHVFNNENYFNFCTENAPDLQHKELILQTDIKLEAADNEKNGYLMNAVLDSNATYCITFDSCSIETGETRSINISLFDIVENRIDDCFIFDISRNNTNEDNIWYFKTPVENNTQFRLLISPGNYGNSAGIGISLNNVTLSKVITE